MTQPQGEKGLWGEVYETPYGWVAMGGGSMTDGFKTREAALESCFEKLREVLDAYHAEFGDLP